MSEAPERESKTEEATPRKLDEARKKGDGPKTMDLGSAATLSAASAVVLIAGGWLSPNMAAELRPFIARPETMSLDGGNGIDTVALGDPEGRHAERRIQRTFALDGRSRATRIDREKAANLGIEIETIGRTLETLLGGRNVTT